jgi:hypothetical protein
MVSQNFMCHCRHKPATAVPKSYIPNYGMVEQFSLVSFLYAEVCVLPDCMGGMDEIKRNITRSPSFRSHFLEFRRWGCVHVRCGDRRSCKLTTMQCVDNSVVLNLSLFGLLVNANAVQHDVCRMFHNTRLRKLSYERVLVMSMSIWQRHSLAYVSMFSTIARLCIRDQYKEENSSVSCHTL